MITTVIYRFKGLKEYYTRALCCHEIVYENFGIKYFPKTVSYANTVGSKDVIRWIKWYIY